MDERLQNRLLVLTAVVAWVLNVIYVLSPIDLIPDFIPFIGWIDDLLAITGTLSLTATVGWMLRNGGWEQLLGEPDPEPIAEDYEPMSSSAIRDW